MLVANNHDVDIRISTSLALGDDDLGTGILFDAGDLLVEDTDASNNLADFLDLLLLVGVDQVAYKLELLHSGNGIEMDGYGESSF